MKASEKVSFHRKTLRNEIPSTDVWWEVTETDALTKQV